MTRDKLLGGLYGLLVGDATGVPYEFKHRANIPHLNTIDMVPPEDFKKGWMKAWSNVPTGTWSDDGSLALCLLEALQVGQTLEGVLDAFAKRAVAWKNEGYLAVDNFRFDIGNQTNHALELIESGQSYLVPGPRALDENNNGNGSLMRTLPVALWCAKYPPFSVVEMAALQSQVTHPHTRSKLCCMLYALVAQNLLLGKGKHDALNEAVYWLNQINETNDEWKIVISGETKEPQGTGYVVDSMWSAFSVFLQGNSYEQVVRMAISLGNDTDTTACIAGGLAGIHYGVENIPQRWMDHLRGKEMVEPLAQRLLEHYGL